MHGLIFDIQNYSLYDGPGIRTCVFLKGCPLSCAWCHNPESISTNKQMAYWNERCTACGECSLKCPNQALSLLAEQVVRDQALCTACGDCEDICPNDAMEKIGVELSVDELEKRVLPEIPFFEGSGGGVTLTGGEPTYQAKFILEFCRKLKQQNISCTLETCGYFNPSLLPKLVDMFSLFLFDLKQIDNEKHSLRTGKGNQKILENFIALLKQVGSDRIVPRIPLIPGFNTDENSITAFVEFLLDNHYGGAVHLMPFHNWAKGKYKRIGKSYDWDTSTSLAQAEQARIVELFELSGLKVVWGG